MDISVQKLYLHTLLILFSMPAIAQERWPSPEVEQMYAHAREYALAGDLKDAITTYKQAILLAPAKTVLYKELGRCQYLSADYSEAEHTLSGLFTSKDADAECYQLLAASQAAGQKRKEARRTLKNGISLFPASGLLYGESGKEYADENKREDALNAWLDGIEQDPAFAQNYYEAALAYLSTETVLWGLIYAEEFLDMKHDTSKDDAVKNKLYTGYRKMFDNIVANDVPEYGHTRPKPDAKTFEDAVMKIYTALTPVVSDGITTETLTMVRTRFLMEWFSQYGNKYPFSLFSYHDDLVRSGHFDIYNEWLFGNAESRVQYDAWNQFHEGDIARFLQWQAGHAFSPAARQFYNSRDMEGLFAKKKK